MFYIINIKKKKKKKKKQSKILHSIIVEFFYQKKKKHASLVISLKEPVQPVYAQTYKFGSQKVLQEKKINYKIRYLKKTREMLLIFRF